jgi:polysaccharide biosynthesis protein PslH
MTTGHRVLFVAPFAPRLDATHGGSRVIATLMTRLATRNRVALAYLRDPEEPAVDPDVARVCDVVAEVQRPWRLAARPARAARAVAASMAGSPLWARRWWVPGFAQQLREIAGSWGPDIVQFEFHVTAQYAAALNDGAAARILVQHESGSAAAGERRSAASTLMEWTTAWADGQAWRRYERKTTASFDRVVTFTGRDADQLRLVAPDARIVQIPFGLDLPAVPLSAEGRDPNAILFVGSFNHAPNEEAAVRLVRRILPHVKREHPAVVVMLIGSHPSALIRELQSVAVELHADVPDVTPFLDRAAVVVAPIDRGGGMRVKVVEAMAAGKAMVCSPRAIDGLALTWGEQVKVAETDAQFAAAIVDLLKSAGTRRDIGTRARSWVAEHASADRWARSFEELYSELSQGTTWARVDVDAATG